MEVKDILGSWTLMRHGKYDANKEFTPTGKNMMGKLIYSANGSMSVLILKHPEPTQLSDLIVYSGRFSLSGAIISHHIEVSPTPKRRNTTELRLAELIADELILTTEADSSGYYEIRWRREENHT